MPFAGNADFTKTADDKKPWTGSQEPSHQSQAVNLS